MADTKISELTTATVVNSADYLAIVQTGESRKITPVTFFANVPTPIRVVQAAETVIDGATLDLSKSVSVIDSVADMNHALTLPAGTNGMEKLVVVKNIYPARTATLTVTDGKGVSTVTFDAVGDSVLLRNVAGFWYVIGSKGV